MKQLLPGEETIRTTRQHWSIFVPLVTVAVLVLIVLAGLLYVIPDTVSGRSLHSIKVVILLAALLIAAVAFTLRYMRWRFTTFALTNRRVMVSRGVLSRYMESIALDRIQDVSVNQRLLGRLFRAGEVQIESAGRDGSEVLKQISNPVAFANDLQRAAELHRLGVPFGAPAMGPTPPGTAATGTPPVPGSPGYVPPGGAAGYQPPPPGYNPPRGGL